MATYSKRLKKKKGTIGRRNENLQYITSLGLSVDSQ